LQSVKSIAVRCWPIPLHPGDNALFLRTTTDMEVRNHSKTDLNVCVSEASSVPSRCSAEESTVESAADDRKVQAQHNADSGYYSWGTMSNTATAVCSASESCSITTVNATCYDNGLAYSPVCACCTNGQVTRSSSSLLHKGLPTYPSDSMHQLHGTHYDSNGNLVPQFPAGSTYRNACCVSACITTTPSVDQSSRSRDFVYTKPSLSVNNDIKNGIENHEAETLDLAVKIEFCLKFGFSTRQVSVPTSFICGYVPQASLVIVESLPHGLLLTLTCVKIRRI